MQATSPVYNIRKPQPPPRDPGTKIQSVRTFHDVPRPSVRRLNRSRSSQITASLDHMNATVDLGSPAPPAAGQVNPTYRHDYENVQAYSPREEEHRARIEQRSRPIPDYSPIGRQKSILSNRSMISYRESTPAPQIDSLNRSTSKFDSLRKSFLGISRPSLSSSRITLIRGLGLGNALTSLCAITLASLVFAILSMMLLFQFSEKKMSMSSRNSVVTQTVYSSTSEAGVALTSLSVMLNLCCVTAGILQSFFSAKLLKVPQGEERAFRYLKECAGTRMIAVGGFFFSVPCFLIATLLYILLEFRTASAIIAIVVFTVGVAFVLATVVHSVYFWRCEKAEVDVEEKAKPTTNGALPRKAEQSISHCELSTLV